MNDYSSGNSPKLQAVLFDMDGTLVSSLPVIHYCVNQISKKYANRTLTIQQVISSFGPPAREIVRGLTGTEDHTVQDRAITEYYECYGKNVSTKAVLFDGITDLLSRLQNSGVRLAVVTGIEKTLMDYTLNAFGLTQYFQARISRDDVSKGKPDPEGVELALASLGISRRNRAIIIGDAPADVQAGKRARVLTGAALWSPENIGDPRTEGPDYEFRTVQELVEFLFPAG